MSLCHEFWGLISELSTKNVRAELGVMGSCIYSAGIQKEFGDETFSFFVYIVLHFNDFYLVLNIKVLW